MKLHQPYVLYPSCIAEYGRTGAATSDAIYNSAEAQLDMTDMPCGNRTQPARPTT
ncbi:MAG: hypothetical protein M3014_04360 [Chloroflexota bacterium]|nr:hypothetical protein [Chloroflexota bacterium]